MFGYNTGWKFSGWWTSDAVTSTGNVTAFTRNGISSWTPTYMSWYGPVSADPAMSASIMTHGYNSIRLRFAAYDGNASPTMTTPMTWRVYLVETDGEEDQSNKDVLVTHHSTVLTGWATLGAQPVAPSANYHFLGFPYSSDYASGNGYNGKPWAMLANQVRVIRNDASLGGLLEHIAQDPTSAASFESFAGTMLSKAQGLDVYTGPNTITTAGTPDTTAVTSSSIQAHAYSPAFGNTNTQHGGELYITNLAGAARVLVVPTRYWGYTASVVKNTAPSVGAAGNARDVGFLYNLIQ